MKKLYLLLPILFLIYWGCEDTTPTEVTLWGEVYSVENTTGLDLYNNQLTGEIPSENRKLDQSDFFDFKW